LLEGHYFVHRSDAALAGVVQVVLVLDEEPVSEPEIRRVPNTRSSVFTLSG